MYRIKRKGVIAMDDNKEKDEWDMPVIVLNDDNGDEVSFELLDIVECDNEEFVVLYPLDETTETPDVVILRIQPTGNEDEEEYVGIEDEALLYKVFDMFKEKHKDDYNFVD